MSWTKELYNVYERLSESDNDLLPLYHTRIQSNIEIVINEDGDFVRSDLLNKEIIVPFTDAKEHEKKYILGNRIKYLAGDYNRYTLDKKDEKHFKNYLNNLKIWAESEYTHPAVQAVYKYVQKECMIADLIKDGKLKIDDNTGKLENVKIAGSAIEDYFVRFRVNFNDLSMETETWKDKSLYDKYIEYFNNEVDKITDLCYATGDYSRITYKHPDGIIKAGDHGKLISANDEKGFSYRGRFDNKEQAIAVGYEFSQKVHNALKWLVKNQGIKFDKGFTLVVWESSLELVPDITQSADDLYDDEFYDEDEQSYDSLPIYKSLLNKMIFGKKGDISISSKVMILAINSNDGRLSISMYTELSKSEFLKNLEIWHRDSAWIRRSYKNNEKEKNEKEKYVINSFSVYEIVERAFGTEREGKIECSKKLTTGKILKLIACITQNRKLPVDIVNALVNKASNPLSYEVSKHNHDRVIETACGIIRKYLIETKGVDYGMAVDENCKDRSYLYGMLLAVADAAEESTYESDEKGKRITNARRYWNKFSQSPYKTWGVIERQLRPYLDKGKYGRLYEKIIMEIHHEFIIEEFVNNKSLEPLYILGYYHQKYKMYKSKKNGNENNGGINYEYIKK